MVQSHGASVWSAWSLNIFLPYLLFSFTDTDAITYCPRLVAGNGVDLRCLTMNPLDNTEIARPCAIRSPLNTIAKYGCKRYYNPAPSDVKTEDSDESGIMQCNRNGKWRNFAQYRDFKCQLSAGGWINQVVDANRVVIFSLSYCGYCYKIKQTFDKLRVKYFAIELDLVDQHKSFLLKDALWRKTGMRTYPNIFVSGEHIGGSDKTFAALHSGRLHRLLKLDTGSEYSQIHRTK